MKPSLGRELETPLFRHRDEVTQVPQLHVELYTSWAYHRAYKVLLKLASHAYVPSTF